MILHQPDTGDILDVNQRLETIYGYSTDELRRMDVEEFSANTHPFTQTEAERRIQAAAEGTPQQFEWRVKRSNGELIWVDVHLSRITIGAQRCVLGEIRDITNYKTNDRRVSLFYRLLRHNLRNDVNVISGNAELIKSEPDTSECITFAEKIYKTANNLNEIAESVKQIEETITRKNSKRDITRVADIVNDVADEYREAYPSTSITVSERTELWVDTDQALRNALEHAVENAIKHNDRSDPGVTIRIDESPNTGRVEIKISDTGPPIPETELAAIDDYSETTDTMHGSGIGLFVMKWCVESLGGELKFEERTPRGNDVYFYLPPKDPASD
jgi:PAS domain S-box-containing protein